MSAEISACEKAEDRQHAFQVVAEMLQQHLKPDVVSYNALVNDCAEAGYPRALSKSSLR